MTSKRKKQGQENAMARRITEQIYGEWKKTTFFCALANYLNIFVSVTKEQKIMISINHSISQQLQGFRVNIWGSIP